MDGPKRAAGERYPSIERGGCVNKEGRRWTGRAEKSVGSRGLGARAVYTHGYTQRN